MATINLKTDDKPHLSALMKSNPKLAKEVIETFVSCMEEACNPESGMMWAELPGKFSDQLSFRDLILGILKGSLDLKELNPEAFDAIKEEVHPLSMLMPRKDWLNGGMRRYEWRNHFRLPKDAQINQDTVSDIFRKLLRYYKYVKVDDLAYAMINNQIKTFEGLGERNVAMLPFVPALRYQQKHFGDLHVGKFFDDIGALDCGEIGTEVECPSCQTPYNELWYLGEHIICPSCNAGFKVKEERQ
jgi:hypothetical protein